MKARIEKKTATAKQVSGKKREDTDPASFESIRSQSGKPLSLY